MDCKDCKGTGLSNQTQSVFIITPIKTGWDERKLYCGSCKGSGKTKK